MKTITRASLKKFNADAEKALVAVAEKHGVQVTMGSGSFTPNNATMKFEIATISKDGSVNTKEATDFELYAARFGLERTDLGRTVHWKDDTYKIVGIKPRSRKAPIVVERSDGKQFKMPVSIVNLGLGR